MNVCVMLCRSQTSCCQVGSGSASRWHGRSSENRRSSSWTRCGPLLASLLPVPSCLPAGCHIHMKMQSRLPSPWGDWLLHATGNQRAGCGERGCSAGRPGPGHADGRARSPRHCAQVTAQHEHVGFYMWSRKSFIAGCLIVWKTSVRFATQEHERHCGTGWMV